MFPADTKVLVVDDFKTMRKLVIGALKACGLTNVMEADDGATAWPLFQEEANKGQPFNLVVSDWNMPQMQGIDLLRNVRKHPSGEKLPFVLVTAEAEKANIVQAVEAGVSNYIVKPFNAADFKTKLEQAWNKVSKG